MGALRVVFLAILFLLFCSRSSATNVSYDGRSILIDGVHRLLILEAIHYPRSTAGMWPDLVQKAKEGGLDTIETYVFWDIHEPRHGEYDFAGDHNFIEFIKIIIEAGLYIVLRIGPYVCAEWNYGGFPVWLHQIPGIEFRTDNQVFKDEMQRFTTLIVDMIKSENLLAPQGGPIIITQIENEYGNVMSAYGEAGISYIQWCATMAESLDVGVPWIMCQQSNAPSPMINTCNGYYCDSFTPNNSSSPKMWTENWAGWYKTWGESDPHRPVEDLAYAVVKFYQSGGTFQNYCMIQTHAFFSPSMLYHGGTNFGRTSGGPYLTTSYDYDAPLDEYGNLRQPKWGHLKQLHAALKQMEKVLTLGDANTTSLGNALMVTNYTTDSSQFGCFFENANQSSDANVTINGSSYFLPARSISILPDCKQEVFNTAKVNTQTSIFLKQAVTEAENWSWEWRPEKIKDTLAGKGSFTKNQLLEQINTTSDTSDYLWYMTSVFNSSWSNQVNLRVNTTGHVLHAYVNGRLIGSQYATNGQYQFVFEGSIFLRRTKNIITLLSATVGLANYGAGFENQTAGLVGGPVHLIGVGNQTLDLSNNTWAYKIGLNGEAKRLYSISSLRMFQWQSLGCPKNRPMTWYKATFEVPPGDDRLVLDLQGMGKGQAWVNGKSIGRYWPAFIAPSNTCQPCDYRQQYGASSCRTGCGEPTQRWYHVPRSFTTVGRKNVLVLFEEIGGDISDVTLQTLTVGTVYGNAYEGSMLGLSCQGNRTFADVQFASFGNPQGTYGLFKKGACDTPNALDIVQMACLGRSHCSLNVTADAFGPTGCSGMTSRLAVQATCG